MRNQDYIFIYIPNIVLNEYVAHHYAYHFPVKLKEGFFFVFYEATHQIFVLGIPS